MVKKCIWVSIIQSILRLNEFLSHQIIFVLSLKTRKVSRPPASQFSSSCGELVAFGHLEGPLGPLDSCMESCIVRDHSC